MSESSFYDLMPLHKRFTVFHVFLYAFACPVAPEDGTGVL